MDINKLLAAGMHDDELRLSQISNNVANLSTPGYKRQSALHPAFNVQFEDSLTRPSSLQASIGIARSFLDTKSGTMRVTGNARDLCVDGDGYIEVSGLDGISYVRQANLRIDSQGRLVNQNGLPVHANSGEINLPASPFSLNEKGEILQDGEVVARLKLMAPVNALSMVATGDGTYRFAGEMRQVEEGRFKIGFSEGSNVDTSREMTELLETVRHFESLQKMAQAYTELHDKAAHYLGEF
jgi:flagellar basal-body rod protein FlgG